MKNRFPFRAWFRLCAFCLGFILFLLFADVFLVRTDVFARLTMHEMKNRSDIEVAFVGSSIVRDHFDAASISQEIGKTCFNAAIPCAGLQADIAVTEELYRTNKPEWTVLVLEPYALDTLREGIEAQYDLINELSSPAARLRYYWRVAREDGWWLDRALMFRDFGIRNLHDLYVTVGMRLAPERTYEKIKDTLDKRLHYQKHGFVRYETQERATDLIRHQIIREHTGYHYELFDRSREMLLAYRDMVEANGSKLLVVVVPNHTAHALAEPGFLPYMQSLAYFCRDNGIPLANFALAKSEFLPNLDHTYFDLYHMNGEGADVFSHAFAKFFNAFLAGEDTHEWFYSDTLTYLHQIHALTNTWISPVEDTFDPAWEQNAETVMALAETQDVFVANSNHSPLVTPEYRFYLKADDGKLTPLGDWQTEGIFTCGKGERNGQVLRVYARKQGKTDPDPECWFDFTIGVDEAPVLAV